MNTSLQRLWLIAVLLCFALGITLRVVPFASFTGMGFDEALYKFYVTRLVTVNLFHYPEIVNEYIEQQKALKGSIAPPLRFLFVGTSGLWCAVFGVKPIDALRQVASFFSILTLGVSFGCILRMAGRGAALAVLALMVCAPTQIHMSQHALVDGFFTFWALLTLWMLWENLQQPAKPALLVAYGASLAFMVMTKENSAFVYIAVLAILGTNRWFKFGTVNRPLVLTTLIGPSIGALALVTLAGGLESFFTTYILSVSKNFTLDYAIKTGDGPWSRYLIDLMIVSPVVLILAIVAIFQLKLNDPKHRPQLFFAVFIATSYFIMCNLKYGMNLRYTNMWDAPLRLLAFTELGLLATQFAGKRRDLWLSVSVVALCSLELHQYWVMGIEFPRLYELTTEILLNSVHILK